LVTNNADLYFKQFKESCDKKKKTIASHYKGEAEISLF